MTNMISFNPAKIHPCGYPIYVETVWNGITRRPIFCDGNETSDYAGQRIYDCPRCGEYIMARDFDNAPEIATPAVSPSLPPSIPPSALLIGGECSIMLSDMGLSVFRVPRSIFDKLPGPEVARTSSDLMPNPYWIRYARLRHPDPTINAEMVVTFYCETPSIERPGAELAA
jgi:hypothetical protein